METRKRMGQLELVVGLDWEWKEVTRGQGLEALLWHGCIWLCRRMLYDDKTQECTCVSLEFMVQIRTFEEKCKPCSFYGERHKRGEECKKVVVKLMLLINDFKVRKK